MLLYSSSQCVRLFSPVFKVTETMLYVYKRFPRSHFTSSKNREGAVAFCFGLKPWHGYQPSLHVAWISCSSLNSVRLTLCKSPICVCCTRGMTSTQWSASQCFATEEGTNTLCK